jgi:hypothetical protein
VALQPGGEVELVVVRESERSLVEKTFSTLHSHSCSLGGMFVRLGTTYDMHRAHIVRGVLESHGVPAAVWHEAPHPGFIPGWLGCDVVVPEEEYEAAVEVLHARPEEIPEQGTADAMAPFRKHPTFLDWVLVGGGLILVFGILYVFALIPEHVGRGHTHATLMEPMEVLTFLVMVPVAALSFAVLITVALAPLRIWDGNRWMGMIAYLFVRWFLCVVLPVLVAAILAVLEPR